jgi:hypothetical protein
MFMFHYYFSKILPVSVIVVMAHFCVAPFHNSLITYFNDFCGRATQNKHMTGTRVSSKLLKGFRLNWVFVYNERCATDKLLKIFKYELDIFMQFLFYFSLF